MGFSAHLPDALLLHIASYLCPHELVSCTRVNRTWRPIMRHDLLWSAFLTSRPSQDHAAPPLWHIFRDIPQVRDVRFFWGDQPSLPRIMAWLRNPKTYDDAREEVEGRHGLILPARRPGDMDIRLRILMGVDGACALVLRRLTLVQALQIPADRLHVLLESVKEEGALTRGLITATRAMEVPYDVLVALCSHGGITALERRLMTCEDACRMPVQHLAPLLSPEGLEALSRRLLTPDTARGLSHRQLGKLLTPDGMNALAEGLLTATEAADVDEEKLSALLSPGGMDALRRGLVTPEDAAYMPLRRLQLLVSPIGIEALTRGLLTSDAASTLPYSLLAVLFSPGGLHAMVHDGVFVGGNISGGDGSGGTDGGGATTAACVGRDHSGGGDGANGTHMTVCDNLSRVSDADIDALPSAHRGMLLTPEGLCALQRGLTCSVAAQMSVRQLECLLRPAGLRALRTGVLLPHTALAMEEHVLEGLTSPTELLKWAC